MYKILFQIARAGIRSETRARDPTKRCGRPPRRSSDDLLRLLGRALADPARRCRLVQRLRAGNPRARTIPTTTSRGSGIKFVASPRHADMLLVTGPVSRNMEEALRRTYEAMPDPKLVVAIGDCGCDGGIFGENYASRGRVANVIPVDVAVPGCPPEPAAIIRGILTAVSAARK